MLVCGFISTAEQKLTRKTIKIDGVKRTYYMYRPEEAKADRKFPLVLILHGGGGNPLQVAKHTQFQALAEKYGFVVIFPEGLNKHWNDGRKIKAHEKQDREISDIKFIRQLIKETVTNNNIDPRNIFAAGISNGGFMCQRLAVEASDIFAAVVSVAASLQERWKDTKPAGKISIMLINGTADPLVPYNGGTVSIKFPLLGITLKRGKIISTDKTIEYWLKNNALKVTPAITNLKDIDPKDGCHAVRYDWQTKALRPKVVLIKVINGGHTWPGKKRNLSKRRVSKICQDFDASETIWRFFDSLIPKIKVTDK
jgi:polyhydroxybutyrate depolymerase